MTRQIPAAILEEFAAGVLELRGVEVWKVRRKWGTRATKMTAHRIDKPSKSGTGRVVIRRGYCVYSASMPAILKAVQQKVSCLTIAKRPDVTAALRLHLASRCEPSA
jgi:hypothetical protein